MLPRKLTDMRRKDWLWVERRAAELGFDAPRGPVGADQRYSHHEWIGWSIHYWADMVRGERARWALQLRDRVPQNRRQWAGWLAREIYLATWS